MHYGFDVVGRVVAILQKMNVVLDSVTLAEAKELTVAVVVDHRRTEQAKSCGLQSTFCGTLSQSNLGEYGLES